MVMKKLIILLILVLFLVHPVLGAKSEIASEAKDKGKGPIIVDEGFGVKKAIFIHYAKKDRSETAPLESTATTCYAFLLATEPKWYSTVTYVINPKNPQGLSTNFIGSAISPSAETWDDGTVTELFNDAYTYDSKARFGKRDGKNVLAFGNYRTRGVIAVTYTWYTTFPLPRILEFDVLFDTDFQWGDATKESSKMDLQNIATHEIGHGIGLADLYNNDCMAVTMYGYSTEGEIEKRSLEVPDILGLQSLYGS
jgi:hypothetical protein